MGEFRRAELRSPDPTANPYLAFALLIYAGLDGMNRQLELPAPANQNLYKADPKGLSEFEKLPATFREACVAASLSEFIHEHVPEEILSIYCGV